MAMPYVNAPEFPEGLAWFNVEQPLSFHDQLRGRIVVLDFWTYCCINCMHVLPDLAYLEKKYAADPVVFIGVHSNKYSNEAHPANVREAVLRNNITHPVVVDEEHTIWGAYGVSAWPTLVVVDATGHIIGALPGEGHREELDRVIAGLLEVGQTQGMLAKGPVPLRPETPHGTPTGLAYPGKVLFDPKGWRLFVSDTNHNRILMLDPDNGEVLGFFGSGVAGTVDGPYEDVRFHHPQGLALYGNALYIADTENHMVRRADLFSYHVDTVLGNGMIGYDRRGGHRGKEQVLNSPWDLAFLNGRLYIAMAGLHQIWAYEPETETVRAVIGTGRENITDNPAPRAALAQPSGLAADNGLLYFADSETSAIRRYDPQTQEVATLVGQGLFDFGDKDGPEQYALMQHPLGVAAQGTTVFAADSYNHKIRRIDLRSGMVTTVTGLGYPALQEDGRLGLYEPGGISVAGNDLFIADTNHDRIIRYNLRTAEWREIVPNIKGRPLAEAA